MHVITTHCGLGRNFFLDQNSSLVVVSCAICLAVLWLTSFILCGELLKEDDKVKIPSYQSGQGICGSLFGLIDVKDNKFIWFWRQQELKCGALSKHGSK